MIDLNKVAEGVHYELIPADVDNDQAWDVRIKEGDFVETVIRFGNIAFNEETDCLNFNFFIRSTPDPYLTEESPALQDFAGLILEDVLEQAIARNELVTREKDGS